MSRYQRGDVVLAYHLYYDEQSLPYAKVRPFVIIEIDDETENITVKCTSKTRHAEKLKGTIVLKNSAVGQKMRLLDDTFIFLNEVIILSNKDIIRKIGTCPIIDDLEKKLSS